MVSCLCHIADSTYLLGIHNAKLRVWDEQKEQEMCQISVDPLSSIKRVINTNNYILKTKKNGLKLLTIRDLELKKITIQHLLDVIENGSFFTESLQV